MDGAQRAHLALAWQAPAGGAGLRTCFDFASLPHAVALHVLSFMPADARARAALVCRAWRALTGERSLWTTLDLSPESGVPHPVSDAVLRGAAARAGGQLAVLNLNDCNQLTQNACLDVLAANSSMLVLCCIGANFNPPPFASVEALASAAPQLRTFEAGAGATVAEATRMLRNDAPFGSLRVRKLYAVYHVNNDDAHAETVQAFAAALSGHAPLSFLVLHNFPLDAAPLLHIVLAAVLARPPDDLLFHTCGLSPAAVSAVGALCRKLTCIGVIGDGQQLLNESAAVQLAGAFAANQALDRLLLSCVDFWRDAAAATTVLQALTGHPSLCDLVLSRNDPPDQAAAGAALAALVAANTPSLLRLRVHFSALGDAGLSPLLDALAHNTHLQELTCSNVGMSEAFARDRLLPAIRENTSLRKLNASPFWGGVAHGRAPAEVLEAEALVAARNDGA